MTASPPDRVLVVAGTRCVALPDGPIIDIAADRTHEEHIDARGSETRRLVATLHSMASSFEATQNHLRWRNALFQDTATVVTAEVNFDQPFVKARYLSLESVISDLMGKAVSNRISISQHLGAADSSAARRLERLSAPRQRSWHYRRSELNNLRLSPVVAIPDFGPLNRFRSRPAQKIAAHEIRRMVVTPGGSLVHRSRSSKVRLRATRPRTSTFMNAQTG